MKPGAAKAVHSWLQEADDKGKRSLLNNFCLYIYCCAERDVAVRLFSSLGSRPAGGMRQRSFSESDSRPPSRKPFLPPESEVLHSRRMINAPPSNKPPKPWPAGVWHHKPMRDPPPQVYHRGALFGGVRGGASHYTIHPEWPDYYSPSSHSTSDVVH